MMYHYSAQVLKRNVYTFRGGKSGKTDLPHLKVVCSKRKEFAPIGEQILFF